MRSPSIGYCHVKYFAMLLQQMTFENTVTKEEVAHAVLKLKFYTKRFFRIFLQMLTKSSAAELVFVRKDKAR